MDLAVPGPGRFVSLVRTYDGSTLWKHGLPEDVTAAKIAPNGELLAAAAGTRVYLFALPRRRLLRTLSQHARVTAIAFSADSKRLAAGGADHIARIWTLLHVGRPLELKGHHKGVTGVAFSPDGTLVATSSDDATAKIWAAHTGRLVRTLAVGNAPVLSVAFSPDGRHVVTAGADHDARLWNTDGGLPEQVLHWHFTAVRDAQFSPDGRWIATITAQSGQLWRVGGDGPLFRFGIKPVTGKSFAGLTSVAFDPTSSVVLTTADDGVVRTYTCKVCGGIDEMLHLAEARLAITHRTLTRAEQKLYGG